MRRLDDKDDSPVKVTVSGEVRRLQQLRVDSSQQYSFVLRAACRGGEVLWDSNFICVRNQERMRSWCVQITAWGRGYLNIHEGINSSLPPSSGLPVKSMQRRPQKRTHGEEAGGEGNQPGCHSSRDEEWQLWLANKPKRRRKASLGECASSLVPGLPWGGVTRLVHVLRRP